MKINEFRIINFKGVQRTVIELEGRAPGKVTTLIGLNESGKTTILEAISHFVSQDTDTSDLVNSVAKKSRIQDLVPKDQKAAFTGDIAIVAIVQPDQDDLNALAVRMANEFGLVFDKESFPKTFPCGRTYSFVDSSLEGVSNIFQVDLNLRKKSERKFRKFSGYKDRPVDEKNVWVSAANFLRDRMPKVVYFPTFLFDFPGRIYLNDIKSDMNAYYKQVIQDVLDSRGEGLDVNKHVIDRIEKVKELHDKPETFISAFYQSDEKKMIDAVMKKVSSEMSRVIFGAWNDILGRSVSGKRVEVEWYLDPDKSAAPYIEISILDGQTSYSLSERSLGFRWFFSFLLFTEFRKNRRKGSPTIFLFDEPAANLHSKAQMKLLETFARIASGDTQIIYSTHSHYMVNPVWLEKAYIIENKATDYDSEMDIGSFAERRTEISAVKYKTFIGSNPSKTTYFQPVLDALEVRFSPLIQAARAVIVEGKNDYYPIVYLRRRLAVANSPVIFPCNGATTVGQMINLFRGWGTSFCVILDDDKAGKTAKEKYAEDHFLLADEIVTLGDIDSKLAGKSFEAIYQDDVINAAKIKFSVSKPNKKQMGLFFQELAASRSDECYADTENAFRPISQWLDAKFGP